MPIRIQKIRKVYNDALEVALKYYAIINVLNNFQLAQREVQLLAFTALKGNISYKANKEEFAKTFDSSVSTVSNMIGTLKKIGLLVKVQGKFRVNPDITLPFETRDIGLSITLQKKADAKA